MTKNQLTVFLSPGPLEYILNETPETIELTPYNVLTPVAATPDPNKKLAFVSDCRLVKIFEPVVTAVVLMVTKLPGKPVGPVPLTGHD